jgi:hypothetical protein
MVPRAIRCVICQYSCDHTHTRRGRRRGGEKTVFFSAPRARAERAVSSARGFSACCRLCRARSSRALRSRPPCPRKMPASVLASWVLEGVRQCSDAREPTQLHLIWITRHPNTDQLPIETRSTAADWRLRLGNSLAPEPYVASYFDVRVTRPETAQGQGRLIPTQNLTVLDAKRYYMIQEICVRLYDDFSAERGALLVRSRGD